ncbi:MAG: sigma-54 dependent transcriptional regulator [Candidatus Zixiibacteriota bacterium]
MAKILVVDDEAKMALLLASTLEDAGHSISIFHRGDEALNALANEPYDLVITDLKMPPPDGLEILSTVRQSYPDTGVILMTAYATAESAITAMKNGAYDYLIKPFSLDEMTILVDRFFESRRSKVLNEQLTVDYEKIAVGEFIGASGVVHQLFGMIDKVAKRESTVLLIGESGTGKELVANMIHKRSPRVGGPFIALNCAALTETLLESELFGHEKGAFTGAIRRKPGRFELAQGGTLFLDEIGEISASMQAKLLRVLELGQYVRVGGTENLQSDARIIAATNRDLKGLMETGGFRSDLYFRLSVFPIVIPPLRERREDIALLADYFLRRFNYKHGALDKQCLDSLRSYPFPGNVRELKNIIERAVILADGDPISPDLLGIQADEQNSDVESGGLNDAERKMIVEALNHTKGNKTLTAENLKITRRRLYSRMKIYNITCGPDGTFR